jgi:hypothetical protein
MRHDEQVFFREEQSFRQPWVWACVLLPMVLIGGGLLWQVLTGRPWGNHPLPTGALLSIEVVLAVIAVWVYQMRLVTETCPYIARRSPDNYRRIRSAYSGLQLPVTPISTRLAAG